MIKIKYFKNIFPNFPYSSKEELDEILKTNQLSTARFSEEGDKASLKEITLQQSILAALQHRFIAGKQNNVMDVFLDCDELDEANETMRLLVWSEYVAELLEEEPNPLNIVTHCTPSSRPLEFAGILIALLRNKKITPKAILESGVLHGFYHLYSINIELVEKFYSLLLLVPETDPSYRACKHLVTIAHLTSNITLNKPFSLTELRDFNNTSISGKSMEKPFMLFGYSQQYKNCYVHNGHNLKYINLKRKKVTLNIPPENQEDLLSFLTSLQAQLEKDEVKLPLTYEQLGKLESIIHYQPSLEKIKVQIPEFKVKVSITNLRHLYQLFGTELILLCLTKKILPHETGIYKLFLSQLSLEEIKDIYETILRYSDNDLLKNASKVLSSLINSENLTQLLQHPHLAWSIISLKPEALLSLNEEDFHSIIKIAFTPKNFKLAIDCIKHLKTSEAFLAVEELFFQRLIKALQHFPDKIELTPTILKALSDYPKTNDFCKASLIKWKKKLQKTIKQNSNPFTYDGYLNIYQNYEVLKNKAHVLQQVAPSQKLFPTSNYQLQCFILNEIYKTNPELDIAGALTVIYPASRYSDYDDPEGEAKKLQMEMLYLWLTTEPSEIKQQKIIEVLQEHYHIKHWKNQDFGGKWIFIGALEHNNASLIHRYLVEPYNAIESPSDETITYRISKINQMLSSRGFEPLLDYATNNLFWIKHIVPFYPNDLLSKYLLAKFLNFQNSNPEVFSMFLHAVPDNQRLAILSRPSSSGRNLLQLAVSSFRTFQLCFQCLPESERAHALHFTNKEKQNLFHFAALSMDINDLEQFLDLIKAQDCFQDLLIKDKNGNNFFHLLAKRTDIQFSKIQSRFTKKQIDALLKERNESNEGIYRIFAKVNAEQLLEIDIKQQQEILFEHFDGNFHELVAAQPIVFEAFLNDYPLPKQLEILSQQNYSGTTVFEVCCEHSSNIDLFLKKYQENLFQLAKFRNLNQYSILHKLVDKPKILDKFLALLSDDEILKLLSLVNNDGETVLHIAARRQLSALAIALDHYPKNKLIQGLKQKNIHGQSVVNIAIDQFKLPNTEQETSNITEIASVLFQHLPKENAEHFLSVFSLPEVTGAVANPHAFFKTCKKPLLECAKKLQSSFDEEDTEDTEQFTEKLLYNC